MPAALLLEDFSTIDILGQPETIEVLGSQLRAGMVIVDELGCPAAGLDHKAGKAFHGASKWLLADLDKGGWSQTWLGHNAQFRVVAR